LGGDKSGYRDESESEGAMHVRDNGEEKGGRHFTWLFVPHSRHLTTDHCTSAYRCGAFIQRSVSVCLSVCPSVPPHISYPKLLNGVCLNLVLVLELYSIVPTIPELKTLLVCPRSKLAWRVGHINSIVCQLTIL